MPLIEVHNIKKLTATVQLDEPVALDVDRYAAFIHASADDVINKALEYVFARDKEFQSAVSANPDAHAARSLRVKHTRRPPKAAKNGTTAVSAAGK
jgi:hypothetical protein